MLDAMLLSAGAELTLAGAAAVGADWIPDTDDASLPLLGGLFLVCMLLWMGNRCGRTKAAFGGFAAAASIATVVISVRSVDCWVWLTVSGIVLATAAVAAFGPRAFISSLCRRRLPRRDLARLAALGESSARLFHDLANPLTAVSLAVTELASGGRPALAKAHVDRALRAARRLDDQLAHARKYARPGPRGVFSVRDELAALIAALAPQSRRAGVRVTLQGDDAELYGDPFEFYRAISNIVLNGIEACEGREECVISITISRQKEGTNIRIKDTGCGMDPKTLVRSRRASFTTKPYGTGLGLPIALDILESEFGARIGYESVPGAGTTVAILMPEER